MGNLTEKNDKINHRKTAKAVASGIKIADYDSAIGALIILGLIAFPLYPPSAMIGIPLLLLFIWGRNSELKG